MGDELLSQIAQDVREIKTDQTELRGEVRSLRRELVDEGPAGKPSVRSRLDTLEHTSRIVTWIGGTFVGGIILGAIAYFSPTNGGPK